MSDSLAQQLSNDLASAASRTAPSLVLLRGRRGRAASGTVDRCAIVSSSPTICSTQTTRSARAPADGEIAARVVGRDAGTDLALLRRGGRHADPGDVRDRSPCASARSCSPPAARGRAWSRIRDLSPTSRDRIRCLPASVSSRRFTRRSIRSPASRAARSSTCAARSSASRRPRSIAAAAWPFLPATSPASSTAFAARPAAARVSRDLESVRRAS